MSSRERAGEPGTELARTGAAARRDEVPGLTGLRFVAAFAVLLAHSASMLMRRYETPYGVVYWCMQASGFGMTLFFVLSGFVIHYNYAAAVTGERVVHGIAAFLWARFARLYPLFLLTLCGGVTLHIIFHVLAGQVAPLHNTLRALPYFLLLIQSWVYVPIGNASLIYAAGAIASLSWSISTELFFYLLFPAIAWLVLRARTARVAAALVFLWSMLWIAVSTGLYDRAAPIDAWATLHFGAVAAVDHVDDSFVRWLLYFSPYLRIGEFVLGTLIAQFYIQLRIWRVTSWENLLGTIAFIAAAASVFGVTYLNYSPNVPMNFFRKMSMNFALAPSAALLIFSAARYQNIASYVLNSRLALALGDASYSIYLMHFGVLMAASWLFASYGVVLDCIRFVFAMATTIAISMALYSYYEAPARKWLRLRWDKPTRAVSKEASQSPAR